MADALRAALHGLPALAWHDLARTRLDQLAAAVTDTLAGSSWTEPAQATTGYLDAARHLSAAAECQTAGHHGVSDWIGTNGAGEPPGDGTWHTELGQPTTCQGPQLLWIAIFLHDATRTLDPQVFAEAARRAGETHQHVTGVLAGTGHPGGRTALQAFLQEHTELTSAQDLVSTANRSLLIYLHTGIGQAVATTIPSPPEPVSPTTATGTWAGPGGRSFGRTINAIYEIYVQQLAARLSGRDHGDSLVGHEYKVENGGRQAWLDTVLVEVRGGEPIEIGIDAKGSYAQFIDGETGEFKDFWTNLKSEKSGLDGELRQAKRQTSAMSRPIEWWCLERETAEAFDEAFQSDDRTRGKVRAKWVPIPKEWM
ncbi:hypothetical protein [Microlunatus sp. GCM10028923]|uniref:hypothetical protein n=1 Tax=Microlunatus sp. GCM10028923 TaxID=3273400 RepID=UPI003610E71A